MIELPEMAGPWFSWEKRHGELVFKHDTVPDTWTRSGHHRSNGDEPICTAARVERYEARGGIRYSWAVYDIAMEPVERGVEESKEIAMAQCDGILLMHGCPLHNLGAGLVMPEKKATQ